MRLLYTVHGFPPEPCGGTERYAARVVTALAARGHDVAVLTRSLQSAEPPDLVHTMEGGVPVFRYLGPKDGRLHWTEFSDPTAEGLVRALLTTRRPDLLHVHHWIGLTSRLVATAGELGIPAVVTLHDAWAVCPRIFRLKEDLAFCQDQYGPDLCLTCAPRRPWETDAVRSALLAARYQELAGELAGAQCLIVPSAAHGDLLARASGIAPSRFEVVPHPALTALRRSSVGHGPSSSRPLRIGCWSSIVPHKGHDVLLRALPMLPPAPSWEIHIFGSPEDRRFEVALKRLAQGYPVSFHGVYSPEDLARAELDLAVFPSLAPESFSFTLDEALQLGLPMIVSDRGALAERAGPGALVVPAGDPEALAHALRRILEAPSLLTTLQAAVPARPGSDLETHLDRLEAIYARARSAPVVPRPREVDGLAAVRHRQVLERERALEELEPARAALSAQLDQLRRQLTDKLVAKEIELTTRKAQLTDQQLHLDRLQAMNFELTHSRGFALLTLFRELKGLVRPSGIRDLARLLREGGLALLGGHAVARARRLGRLVHKTIVPSGETGEPVVREATELDRQYQAWCRLHTPTPEQLVRWRQETRQLPYRPLISVVTPVYNVDEAWLKAALDSVRNQIYDSWELCLVNDASTSPHIRAALGAAAEADPRIRVKHLPLRQGIVGASNAALAMATGEFVTFLDHDDELAPHALYRVVGRLNQTPVLDLLYSDEDKVDEQGRRFEPAFKPDFAPDLLRSFNYIGHLCVIRTELVRKLGGFRPGFDGSQDYDLLLRVTEVTDRIARIPDVLYHWRTLPGSSAGSLEAKTYAYEAAVRALEESLARRGTPGHVEIVNPGRYRVRYRLRERPRVSIIIPMRDRWELTDRCIRSIEDKSSYLFYEILVLDNQSAEPASQEFLRVTEQRHRVLAYDADFNYSKVSNFGARHAEGSYLLFLNNDTEVISGDWIEAMLEQAERPEVGAVGARLLYPDGRLQHAGVYVMGTPSAIAGHMFKFSPEGDPGYLGLIEMIGNRSAVTAAALMIRRETFEAVGGFDEAFGVAFGDVDLCLRIRNRGYLIVYTPVATLYHHESASRGALHPPKDDELFRTRWERFFQGDQDPYWNPNLSVETEVFRLAP